MKSVRIIFLSLLVLGVQPAFADEGQLLSGQTMNYIGYGAIMLMLVVLIIAMLVVLKAFKVLAKALLGPEAVVDIKAEKAAKKAARGDMIIKLLSLKPMSEEQTILLEGEYDGIKELDNPTPAWFMYLFYGTIAFAVCYLLIYHVFDAAPLQYQEYKNEMAVAAKEKAVYLAKAGNMVDENTVKLTAEPAVVSSGHAIFSQRCTPCHGVNGQGVTGLGPNLTDDYWLHGNKINDLFKTIKYGVASKGMPTWETQLSPKQISEVANYVKSIHGTNPPNPKEPQGTKMADDAASSGGPPKTAMLQK
ncbi:MAG: cbb3-type cytochrome c oxidase N-terminal domain-containing protein [Mucilaginibacter sp.]